MAEEIILTTPAQLKILLIESVTIALKHHRPSVPTKASSDDSPYGDFAWLKQTCTGIPESTLRQKSASGEISGITKVGKRVLYLKVDVLHWLAKHKRYAPATTAQLEENAENQFLKRHLQ